MVILRELSSENKSDSVELVLMKITTIEFPTKNLRKDIYLHDFKGTLLCSLGPC